MIFFKQHIEHVCAEVSFFQPHGGVGEWHVMMHAEPCGEGFTEQYGRLESAVRLLLATEAMNGARPVFKRYFLSDSTNQRPLMHDEKDCTVSCIQQPPLDGSKVALWIYLQSNTDIEPCADLLGSTIVRHNGYEHIWTMGLMQNTGNSYEQTESLLREYRNLLMEHGADIADNCIRTWFFVRDVDTQYNGLVVARRDVFTQLGLTPRTHYISSTGIGGNPPDTKALVQMGCYAIKGFVPSQQTYLYAPTHLNRTYEYGVTFERGTLFRYGDRNHAYISGTASINNKGEVMYLGDIVRQTRRMWENVGKLLEEAGMTLDDMVHIIVYLRDMADYVTVRDMFVERFPDVPTVITLAPVCRPTWLIEMECMAVKEVRNEEFADL